MGRNIPKPELVVVEAQRADGSMWTDAFHDLVEAQTAANERRWGKVTAWVWWDIKGDKVSITQLHGVHVGA